MKKLYLQLALRNLRINMGRNISLGISIALGTAAIILGFALTDGIIRQTIIGFTGTLVEDVMIYPKKGTLIGYKDVLKRYKEIQESIYEIEGIDYVTKKVSFRGVAFSPSSSTNGIFMGMEPEGIRRKTNLEMIQGEYLDDNDQMNLILSVKLAERLDVEVGDSISILVQMPRGGTNANDFTVKGIFSVKTGLQFVDHLVYISLWDTQDLMGLSNNEVLSLGVYLKNPDLVDEYEKRIMDKLHKEGFVAVGSSWKKILKGMIGLYNLIKYSVFIFTSITMIIITVGVVNSIYLSLAERTREIGTMMALGSRPHSIMAILLIEGFFLAFLGAASGCGLGGIISLIVEKTGIEAPTKSLVYLFGGKQLFPYLTVDTLVLSFLFVVSITIIGVAIPVYQASKLKPTEALSHV